MNIIANNCIGGYLYRLHNKEFNNPFIWTALHFNDFIYLIQNYGKINFNDYEILHHESDKRLFNLVIENKLTIRLPHYLFDEKFDKPTKIDGVNIKYNKIWLYINEKYTTRLERFKKNTEDPIFIMDFKDWLKCEKTKLDYLINELKDIKYKIYVIVPYKEYENKIVNNIHFIYDKNFNAKDIEHRTLDFHSQKTFRELYE